MSEYTYNFTFEPTEPKGTRVRGIASRPEEKDGDNVPSLMDTFYESLSSFFSSTDEAKRVLSSKSAEEVDVSTVYDEYEAALSLNPEPVRTLETADDLGELALRSSEEASLYRMEQGITDAKGSLGDTITQGIEDRASEAAPEEEVVPVEPQGAGLMNRVVPSVYDVEGPESSMSAPSLALARVEEPISRGARGNTVEQIQNKLLDLGYDVGRGGRSNLRKNKAGEWSSLDNAQRRGVDGAFGGGVESAVEAFQEDAGLPVTGIVDEDTAKSLAAARELQFKGLDTEGLTEEQATYYNAALEEAKKQGLNGVELAAFMAQAGHESDSFTTLTEYASGAAYEGRKDLGNVQKGDGKKYRGRGHIQLTGRANYKKAGDALGLDLVGNPDLVSDDPSVGAKVSLWFWKNRVREQAADFTDVERVTKVVNGGFNGLTHRKELFDQMTQAWNETERTAPETSPRPQARPN